jgi:hypothetical protein
MLLYAECGSDSASGGKLELVTLTVSERERIDGKTFMPGDCQGGA